jgi:hypothetical protein
MNTGPIAFNISVAVTPERDGSWMVDSIDLDNDGSGDVYYTRELPPRITGSPISQADRRRIVALTHLSRTRPAYRVSVLSISREESEDYRDLAGQPLAVVLIAEMRLAAIGIPSNN